MTSKIKSLSRFSGLLNRSKSVSAPPASSTSNVPAPNFDNAPADSPEAIVGRTVRVFCESGSMASGGEEVLHLPVIVETAESSPSAAAAAAQQIRKFLTKDWATKPHVQYNAIMLIRILSDNPGPSFTRNFDKAFVSTVKEALRNCKDTSTQQILRETLDQLEANKQFQEGMESLIQMWRKEKGQSARLSQGQGYGSRGGPAAPVGFASPGGHTYSYPAHPTQHDGQHRSSSGRRQLPPPIELASRIEEARNTAKILLQLIQSTPAEEVLHNELIREFADRCQSAQKSMQGYINCDAPPPDDDTMLTLIETNEQLSLATTRYQRSVLAARRALGVSPSPNAAPTNNTMSGPFAPPSGPPTQNENLFAPSAPPQQPTQQSAFANREESYLPPLGPPRQANPQSAFTSQNESYQPPSGPPRQPNQQAAFVNRDESFQAPPGPPPSMLARLNSRESQPPRSPPLQQSSDPFADPVEHDRNPPPITYGSRNYNAPAVNPANRPHSQTFSIDAEPMYAPSQGRNTAALDNAYSDRPPMTPPSADRPVTAVSPSMPPPERSPRRPGPGVYHNTGITPSYIGRQTSAANGLTMHGAQSDDNVPEIDGHSEVGRTDERRNTTASQSSGYSSAYAVSPLESRTAAGGNRY